MWLPLKTDSYVLAKSFPFGGEAEVDLSLTKMQG